MSLSKELIELIEITGCDKPCIIDIEVYHNLFLVGIFDLVKRLFYQLEIDDLSKLIQWIKKENPYFIGFNSQHFDLRLIAYIYAKNQSQKITTEDMKRFSDAIILKNENLKDYKGYKWNFDNLDVKEVLGGRTVASLKKIACRLQSNSVDALPVEPHAILTDEQKIQIKQYNKLDILNTEKVLYYILPQLKLRKKLTEIYGVNCISLSDNGIAEKVFTKNMDYIPWKKADDYELIVPVSKIVNRINFNDIILQKFQEELFEWSVRFTLAYDPIKEKKVFKTVFFDENSKTEKTEFEIDFHGLPITYAFGGLHGALLKWQSDKNANAFDCDVASFYPNLILSLKIMPEKIGEDFLKIYKDVVDRRLTAKKEKDKITADCLKIVLNSTFGHFKNIYSALCDPVCGVKICMNGEMELLRLIELCYQNNIKLMCANTDGVFVDSDPKVCVEKWQKEFNVTLETQNIAKYFIKDANNYLIKYKDGSTKVKGASFSYEKNIAKQNIFSIVNESICKFLIDDIPIQDTIRECKNIHQFLGNYSKGKTADLVCHGELVETGKNKTKVRDVINQTPVPDLVRFYKAINSKKGIYWKKINKKGATQWTKVGNADCTNPLNIVTDFPKDLDFDAYVLMAEENLRKMMKDKKVKVKLDEENL